MVYVEDFENEFIRRSAEYYFFESQEFLAVNNCPDYLSKVERRLNEEKEMVLFLI